MDISVKPRDVLRKYQLHVLFIMLSFPAEAYQASLVGDGLSRFVSGFINKNRVLDSR